MKDSSYTLHDALEILGIPEFEERIIESNSHGELGHVLEYIQLAHYVKTKKLDVTWFRPWFLGLVKWAEETWARPESVFQHLNAQLRGPPMKPEPTPHMCPACGVPMSEPDVAAKDGYPWPKEGKVHCPQCDGTSYDFCKDEDNAEWARKRDQNG